MLKRYYRFQLLPSKLALILMVFLYLFGIFISLMLEVKWSMKLFLIIIFLISFFYSYSYLRTDAEQPELATDGQQWKFIFEEKEEFFTIESKPWLSALLIIIYATTRTQKITPYFIWRDSLSLEDYRHLRRLLRCTQPV